MGSGTATEPPACWRRVCGRQPASRSSRRSSLKRRAARLPGSQPHDAGLDVADHPELDRRPLVAGGRVGMDADVLTIGTVVAEDAHRVMDAVGRVASRAAHGCARAARGCRPRVPRPSRPRRHRARGWCGRPARSAPSRVAVTSSVNASPPLEGVHVAVAAGAVRPGRATDGICPVDRLHAVAAEQGARDSRPARRRRSGTSARALRRVRSCPPAVASRPTPVRRSPPRRRCPDAPRSPRRRRHRRRTTARCGPGSWCPAGGSRSRCSARPASAVGPRRSGHPAGGGTDSSSTAYSSSNAFTANTSRNGNPALPPRSPPGGPPSAGAPAGPRPGRAPATAPGRGRQARGGGCSGG